MGRIPIRLIAPLAVALPAAFLRDPSMERQTQRERRAPALGIAE